MSNKTSDKNVANIERLKQMVEIIPLCDFPKFQIDYDNALLFANDIKVILEELEQKDKRIQELEEENAMLKKADNIARDVNIEEVTEVMNKSYEEFMSNYINKQKVIDVINEYKAKIEKYNEYRI